MGHLLMVLMLGQQVPAQDWVGQRVITRYGTVLKVGGAVVDDERRSRHRAISGVDRNDFRVYRAEAVNGHWLWLAAETVPVQGWAHVEDVIPYDQAIDYITTVIRKNPSSNAYAGRALVWADKKEYDIAIGDYNEAIRLDPGNETAYYNRGIAWYHKKELDKAVADYSEAIRLDPQYSSAYTNRAVVWRDKKNLDKALADDNSAIRLDPKDSAAYYNRGNVWLATNDLDKAVADYSEAIRLDPKLGQPYYARGLVWEAKHAFDKALADYAEVIRLEPELSAAYNARAWLWATCPEGTIRDGTKAVASSTRACELTGWKVAAFLDTLAAAHAESGDFDAAMKWQRKAIELLPRNAEKARNDFDSRLELYQSRKPYRDERKAQSN